MKRLSLIAVVVHDVYAKCNEFTICALLSAKRLQGTRISSEVVSAEWLAAVNLFSRLCAHICTIVQHALHESFQNRFQFFLRRQSCRTLECRMALVRNCAFKRP